jgi:hypothetical protein
LRGIISILKDPSQSLVCKFWCFTNRSDETYRLILCMYSQEKFMARFTTQLPFSSSQMYIERVNQIFVSVWTLVKEAGITSHVKQIQLNEHLGLLELNPVMKMLEDTEAALIELFKKLGKTIPAVQNLLNDDKFSLKAETIRAWMKDNSAELLTVTLLNLNNLNLTVLPPEIGLLTNLQDLYLKGNQLTVLPPEFGKLIKLQELYLYGNPFPALPPVFGKLINLRKFSLYGDQPTYPGIRQEIDLHRLYLQDNPPPVQPLKEDLGLLELNRDMKMLEEAALIALFKELGKKIPKVRNLLKDHNFSLNAETIRAWMKGNSEKLLTVTKLALCEIDLAALPQEIGLLINLKELYLTGNQIAVLPPEIGLLINLEILILTDNQITVLPPEIGQLLKLLVLNLSGNQLIVLPPEFFKLPNLQKLSLEGNQITVLPPEIGQLISLLELYLANNLLRELPPEFDQLVNLKLLSLR